MTRFGFPSPLFAIISIVLVVAAALRVLPLLLPEARLWGMDAFLYLDPMWTFVGSGLLVLFAIPGVQRSIYTTVSEGNERLWQRRFILLAGVLFIASILFPMGTFFYGDGGTFVTEIYKIGAQEAYTSSILFNVQSAPLAGALLHGFALLVPAAMHSLGMTLPETPMFAFTALSLLGVLVFVLVLYLQRNPIDRTMYLLLLCGTGAVLLFFSYAELYLPMFLAVVAFLFAAQRAMRGELSKWVAILLFIIAVAAHYSSISLLPALIFTLFAEHPLVVRLVGNGRRLLMFWAASIGIIFVLYVVLGFAQSESRIVMPMFDVSTPAGTQTYTLFSSAHLVDLVNLVFLLAAIPALFLTAMLLRRGSRPCTVEFRLLSLAILYYAAFIFFANTSLGLARDWDIAAVLGAMMVLLLPHIHTSEHEDSKRAGLFVVGLASIVYIIPWIAVNVHDDTAAKRFEAVMKLDDERMYGDYALSGYEALRKYYLHKEQYEDEGRVLERMTEIVGYPEQYRLLVNNILTQYDANREHSVGIAQRTVDRLGATARRLYDGGKERDYAISLGEVDSLMAGIATESITYSFMQEIFEDMRDLAEDTGLRLAYDILMGTGWYMDNKLAEAARALRSVWRSNFRDARIDGMYGSALWLSGEVEAGEAVINRSMQSYKEHPQFLFIVAITYLRLDIRHGVAKSILEHALSMNPPENARAQIQDILGLLEHIASEPLPWESP